MQLWRLRSPKICSWERTEGADGANSSLKAGKLKQDPRAHALVQFQRYEKTNDPAQGSQAVEHRSNWGKVSLFILFKSSTDLGFTQSIDSDVHLIEKTASQTHAEQFLTKYLGTCGLVNTWN